MSAESDDNPWRKLSDEFHMIMGYCIAAWARVDDELFRIFQDCMANTDQSAVIYYRTPGLDIRLKMVGEVVVTTLLPSWERPGKRDPRVKEWNAIAKKFGDLLAVRRRIAHHPVMPRQEPRRFGMRFGEAAPSWYEIYVSQHERLRDSAAKLPPLLVNDLRQHRADVGLLADRLSRYFHDMLTKPPGAFPPPAPPVQSPDPPLGSGENHLLRNLNFRIGIGRASHSLKIVSDGSQD